MLIARAAGWVVILIGVIYALVILNVDMGPALMVILILAVVLFFAGQIVMQNFAAGLVLQGSPMFAVGDQIVTSAGRGHRQGGHRAGRFGSRRWTVKVSSSRTRS